MGIVIIIGILVVAGYWISLRVHPYAKCRVCKGSGRHFGSMYKNTLRRCRKCGGSGRQDRLGVRLFR